MDVKCYKNGSFREDTLGKGIYHAMPAEALKRVAQRYEYGQRKYGKAEAYKDGLPTSSCMDSAFRHLVAYMSGDNSEDHLAACVWNCFAIMEMEMNHPKWQDIRTRKRIRGKNAVTNYPMEVEEVIRND